MLGATHAVGFDTYSMRSSLRKLVLHVSLRRWEQYLGLLRRAALKERSGVFISLLPPVTKLKKENVILERKQESTLWHLFGNVAHNLILVFSFVAVDAKGPQYVWLWMGSRTRKRTSTRGHHILMRSFIDSSR